MKQLRDCTRAEYLAFLKTWGRPLVCETAQTDPLVMTFNDSEQGIVAQHSYDSNNNSDQWKILEAV